MRQITVQPGIDGKTIGPFLDSHGHEVLVFVTVYQENRRYKTALVTNEEAKRIVEMYPGEVVLINDLWLDGLPLEIWVISGDAEPRSQAESPAAVTIAPTSLVPDLFPAVAPSYYSAELAVPVADLVAADPADSSATDSSGETVEGGGEDDQHNNSPS